MNEFQGLATLVIHTTRPGYWIGHIAEDDELARSLGVPIALTITACGEQRIEVADVLDTSGPIWSGIRHHFEEDEGDPPAITVRPTEPDDAMLAVSMDGCPRIPMPVPVLAYMHDVEWNMPHLYALSEDDGFVATMMLDTDAGLWIRYSSQWHQIVDEDAVDGLGVTEVNDAALAMFDQYDAAGQLVQIGNMTDLTGAPADTSTVPATSATEPVTAAVATIEVPSLLSREDVPFAISAAIEQPQLQWWVSRRIKALGFSDVDLPWETS